MNCVKYTARAFEVCLDMSHPSVISVVKSLLRADDYVVGLWVFICFEFYNCFWILVAMF